MSRPSATTRALAGYAAALCVILVLDALWLGVVARPLYQAGMAGLMNDSPRWIPAVLFYLLYPAGLVFLVTEGGLPAVRRAAVRGAVAGAMAYGAYDATNLAVIRGFPAGLAAIDFCWGTVLTATAAAALAWAVRRCGPT